VIESLAYYLELTSVDEKACARLKQIQAMVSEVNRILERAVDAGRELEIESAPVEESQFRFGSRGLECR
jgi:hypothetical protein